MCLYVEVKVFRGVSGGSAASMSIKHPVIGNPGSGSDSNKNIALQLSFCRSRADYLQKHGLLDCYVST